jgi:hypothetical protein
MGGSLTGIVFRDKAETHSSMSPGRGQRIACQESASVAIDSGNDPFAGGPDLGPGLSGDGPIDDDGQ